MRALSAVDKVPKRLWSEANGHDRCVGSSAKSAALIDGSDQHAQQRLLGDIVADADRLLELARPAQAGLHADAVESRTIAEAAELLLQDEKRIGDGDTDSDAEGGVSMKRSHWRQRFDVAGTAKPPILRT